MIDVQIEKIEVEWKRWNCGVGVLDGSRNDLDISATIKIGTHKFRGSNTEFAMVLFNCYVLKFICLNAKESWDVLLESWVPEFWKNLHCGKRLRLWLSSSWTDGFDQPSFFCRLDGSHRQTIILK